MQHLQPTFTVLIWVTVLLLSSSGSTFSGGPSFFFTQPSSLEAWTFAEVNWTLHSSQLQWIARIKQCVSLCLITMVPCEQEQLYALPYTHEECVECLEQNGQTDGRQRPDCAAIKFPCMFKPLQVIGIHTTIQSVSQTPFLEVDRRWMFWLLNLDIGALLLFLQFLPPRAFNVSNVARQIIIKWRERLNSTEGVWHASCRA